MISPAIITIFFIFPVFSRPNFPLALDIWSPIDWTDYHESNWTLIDVSEHEIFPNGQDVSSSLNTLIDSYAADDAIILEFGEGEYVLDSRVTGKSNMVIKGKGDKETVFVIDSGGAFAFFGHDTGSTYAIEQDVLPGEREVVVSGASENFQKGDLVYVVEDLVLYDVEGWGKRGRGLVAFIENVVGDQITLSLPLEVGLDEVASKTAEIRKMVPVQNVGIENVGFRSIATVTGSSTLEFKRAYNVYIDGVFSYNTPKYHVQASLVTSFIVKNSMFEESVSKGGGGQGYGVAIYSLSTRCYIVNNIFKDLRHTIVAQVGTNLNVYAYNLMVDIIKDYCIKNSSDPNCRNSDWIYEKDLNGMTNGQKLIDLTLHGHYSHHELFEGNVIYVGGADMSHQDNGPHNIFFRNFILGQPRRFGYWLESFGIVFQGINDFHVAVGNYLDNNSTIELFQHSSPRGPIGSFIGANFLKGVTVWGNLTKDSKIENSLFLKKRPTWWCKELIWPPFGPSIGYSQNRIPAQSRFYGEECSPAKKNEKPKGINGGAVAAVVLSILGVLCIVVCIIVVVVIIIVVVKKNK